MALAFFQAVLGAIRLTEKDELDKSTYEHQPASEKIG